MKNRFYGIKFRLALLCVGVALLALLLRQLLVLPHFQSQVSELVASQHQSIANYIALDVDNAIARRVTLIGQFAASLPSPMLRSKADLQAWIEQHQRTNPAFNGGLLVVGIDNYSLLAQFPGPPGPHQYDFERSAWLKAAIAANRNMMHLPSPVLRSSEPGILFSAPVRDPAGKAVAILVGIGLLEQPGFLDGIRQSRLGASGSFLLVSLADQLIVHASDSAQVLRPAPLATLRQLHQSTPASAASGVVQTADGAEELWSLAPLPSTGWLIVARMPTEEAFGPVEALRTFLWQGSSVGLALVLALLLFGLSHLLRPLVDAARAIRAMADGSQAIAELPVKHEDEVGELVQGFNVLVARLKQEEQARLATEERLKYMAHHDPLTGLCNRAMLEDRMMQDLARSERHGGHLALLFCDLDGFKEINDRYGHQAGDAVLKQVAQRLAAGRRRSDTVARLGGDEFVILLADLKDSQKASALVARQVLEAVRAPILVGGVRLMVDMSIGISKHHGLAVSPSFLLSQADLAMYEAKRLGKGQFVFADTLGPARLEFSAD